MYALYRQTPEKVFVHDIIIPHKMRGMKGIALDKYTKRKKREGEAFTNKVTSSSHKQTYLVTWYGNHVSCFIFYEDKMV